MGHGVGHDIGDHPLGHDGPTIISALRAEIDDMVGMRGYRGMILMHHKRRDEKHDFMSVSVGFAGRKPHRFAV